MYILLPAPANDAIILFSILILPNFAFPPPTIISPPTTTFFSTPIPPFTIRAPLSFVVACVSLLIKTSAPVNSN